MTLIDPDGVRSEQFDIAGSVLKFNVVASQPFIEATCLIAFIASVTLVTSSFGVLGVTQVEVESAVCPSEKASAQSFFACDFAAIVSELVDALHADISAIEDVNNISFSCFSPFFQA